MRAQSTAAEPCSQRDGARRQLATCSSIAARPCQLDAMQETSGTGFYVYALAWGVNAGLLERSRFEAAVLIGETPVHFDEESTTSMALAPSYSPGVRCTDCPGALGALSAASGDSLPTRVTILPRRGH